MKRPEFRQLLKEDSNRDYWDTIVKSARQRLQAKIRRMKKQGRSVVVVGITMGPNIRGLRDSYFLKMSPKALEKAYRRVMRREIAKVTDNADQLNHIIDTEELDLVGPVMEATLNQALYLATTFKKYRSMYEEFLKKERERGVKVETQPEILRKLTALR